MHQLRSKWNETNFGMCKIHPNVSFSSFWICSCCYGWQGSNTMHQQWQVGLCINDVWVLKNLILCTIWKVMCTAVFYIFYRKKSWESREKAFLGGLTKWNGGIEDVSQGKNDAAEQANRSDTPTFVGKEAKNGREDHLTESICGHDEPILLNSHRSIKL